MFAQSFSTRSLKDNLRSSYTNFREWYDDLSLPTRAFVTFYLALNVLILISLIILTPSWVFSQLAKWAIDLRKLTLGPIYLIILLIAASFPPVIGFGTLTTLCGFTYGWFWGWIVASIGCLLGSSISFTVLRTNLPRFQHWLSRQPSFNALRQAVALKGLPLICMIRLCPFPFTYSNLFFASLTTSCSLKDFLIATSSTTPKLLIHVFIGSRVFNLSDPNNSHKLDKLTIALNIFYIVAGASLGFGVSVYLYKVTMAQAGQISLSTLDDESRIGSNGEGRLRTLDEEEEEIRRELLGDEVDGNQQRAWDVEFDDFNNDIDEVDDPENSNRN